VASGATIDLTSIALSEATHRFYAQASDAEGRTLGCSSAYVDYAYDSTGPTVAVGSPSVTALGATGSVIYTVTYTDANAITLAAGDIQLDVSGATCGSVSIGNPTTTTRDVTLAGCTGDGTVGITVLAGTATDALGNGASASSASATFVVNGTLKTVYYSVGQNTGDHKTGAPNVVINAGIATFDVEQTATNMGVGDRLTAGGNAYFLKSKISNTQWHVVTKLGGVPANLVATPVTSIAHEFGSLAQAEEYAGDGSHLNTYDLVTANFRLNLPCYYDSGPDTTGVIIQGWVADTSNYIKIYTPYGSTEVNLSQRHTGVWDDSRFSIVTEETAIQIPSDGPAFTSIEGLQISLNPLVGWRHGLSISRGASVAHNIVRRHPGNTRQNLSGIALEPSVVGERGYVYNNIVYDFDTAGSEGVATGNASTAGTLVYNNTIVNNTTGLYTVYERTIALNNLVVGSGDSEAFHGTFADGTGYSASDGLDFPDVGGAPLNNRSSQTISFVDAAVKDFRLAPGDSGARGFGANLSADASLAFTTDIEGITRGTIWDIGADQAAIPVYYSVGQAPLTDHKTGTPTVTIAGNTATFSEDQTATNMGVGDVINYDTDNKRCFISKKVSLAEWQCTNAVGGTPIAVTDAAVNFVSHVFDSIQTAVIGASGARGTNYLNTADLTAGNYQLHLPCYYDNGPDAGYGRIYYWTTGPSNYIRVYAPADVVNEVNVSQRHAGLWDSTKFHIETVGVGLWASNTGHVRVEGMQIYLSPGGSYHYGVLIDTGEVSGGSLHVSNSIIKSDGVTTARRGISDNFGAGPGYKTFAWNNIIYDFETTDQSTRVIELGHASFVFNNSLLGGYYGVYQYGGSMMSINNLVQDAIVAYSGSFGAASTHNISNDSTAPGTNPSVNATVLFEDAASDDFHLDLADAVARGAGTDLSSNVVLAFSGDVDGANRATPWDVGADQTPANVFYSVGQSGDHKSGNPTVTISNGIVLFSEDQTSENLGVGDRLTIGAAVYYLAAKISMSQWRVVTRLGAMPADLSPAQAVTSITHEFAGLAAALAGAYDASHLGTKDLVTAGVVLNIPCYYGGGPDTVAVVVDGWVAGPGNYIRIYSPTSQVSEVNRRQRHFGKWDPSLYSLESSSGGPSPLLVSVDYTKIEGLQIKNGYTGASTNREGVSIASGVNGVDVSQNIIRGSGGVAESGIVGRHTQNTRIWNNVVYDCGGVGIKVGNDLAVGFGNTVYNNTVVGCGTGFGGFADYKVLTTAKNNLVQDCTVDWDGYWNTNSEYNLSDGLSAPGTNSLNSVTVSFVDPAAADYHLAYGDVGAQSLGVDLSGDSVLPLVVDIDGATRTAPWDIGADQVATRVYYSVGQTVTSHSKGGNVSILDGLATFTVAQDDPRTGVGDRVTVGSLVYFLASKVSYAQWNVVDRFGATPADLGLSAVTSISHEFDHLSTALMNAYDVDHLNTVDLVAGNYQLNFPCYRDLGPDTGAAVVGSWITGPKNFIKIYASNDTTSEVNSNQRHQGVWDPAAYNLALAVDAESLVIRASYTEVEGLQVQSTTYDGEYRDAIRVFGDLVTGVKIHGNILKEGNPTSNFRLGVRVIANTAGPHYIWNNLLTGFTSTSGGAMQLASDFGQRNFYIFNNTVVNCSTGIITDYGRAQAINNLVYGCTNAFSGDFVSGSDYNATDIADTTQGELNTPTHDRASQTFTFVNAPGGDYHLGGADAAAKDWGLNLSSSAILPFSSDLDGATRVAPWDIGADEAP